MEEKSMERHSLNVALCAVLETLDETPEGRAGESILAIGIGFPGISGNWYAVRNALSSGLLVRFDRGLAEITSEGRVMAARSRAFRGEQRGTR